MGSSFLLTVLICCLPKCKLPNFPTKMQCWQHFLKSSFFQFILLGFIRTIDYNPTGIYLFKVNNRNTRTMCEICSKLTIKTPEWQWLHIIDQNDIIVNLEKISNIVLMFSLLTLIKKMPAGYRTNSKTFVELLCGFNFGNFVAYN